MMPALALPMGAVSLYIGQKLLNNTIYKSFKDLTFVARKHGDILEYRDEKYE